MPPIVNVENLSKSYRIGGLHPGYVTLREVVGGALAAPLKRWQRNGATSAHNHSRETLWALKDVNFKVAQGELVGIIGRNGAGKSTLLKILSRITKPTQGSVTICGRVGSLLEVGTGFHPDLTGRENVFLSGAILGMRRIEIERKFDEIVSFSEIEKFIDTPVKWYSSGMYVRLAFSVAAHLEPEVLIMDEVLAVGDGAFQQKCLDKMRDIRRQGRTIFFVSHNMPAVTRLCKRVILLDKGSIISDGPAQKIVGDYLSASWNVAAEREWNDAQAAPGNEIVRLRRVRVRTESGDTTASIEISNPVGIEMVYEVLRSGHVLTPHIDFFNEDGAHLFAVEDVSQKWRRTPREAGLYTSVMWLPGNYLAEGNVLVCASIITRFPVAAIHVDERNVAAFQVIDNLQGGTARGDRVGTVPGIVRPLLNWTTHYHVSDV